ncbi:uncharacterized protein PG998_000853 [Apiospora kogelbergensis]|uniref:Cyanovirin-N domain-containing protein n=1 Tax=Apiospora kogelbergensis TaxID=1337665 RepID=A0AAW0QWA2_9PEZI
MNVFTSILACFLGLLGLVQAQGFVGNCTWQSANLTGSYLGMYCNDDDWTDYSYQWTWLDLDPCFTNNGGHLIPYDNGNFTTSCNSLNYTATDISFALTAMCSDTSNHFVPTAVDLNTVLWNHNGTLGCFDHAGNATECGPMCDPDWNPLY